MNRPKEIRCLSDILKRELEEQLLPRLALRELAFDCAIVVAAVLDGVVEDGRVRGQPRYRKLVDVAAEHARFQQVARDVVEPEALAEIVQDASGLHAVTSVAPPPLISRVSVACAAPRFAASTIVGHVERDAPLLSPFVPAQAGTHLSAAM